MNTNMLVGYVDEIHYVKLYRLREIHDKVDEYEKASQPHEDDHAALNDVSSCPLYPREVSLSLVSTFLVAACDI
jgi:hypothetical protein